MTKIISCSLLFLFLFQDETAQTFSINKTELTRNRLSFVLQLKKGQEKTAILSNLKLADRILLIQRKCISEDTLFADLSKQPDAPIASSGAVNYLVNGTYYYQRFLRVNDSIECHVVLDENEANTIKWIKIRTLSGDLVREID